MMPEAMLDIENHVSSIPGCINFMSHFWRLPIQTGFGEKVWKAPDMEARRE